MSKTDHIHIHIPSQKKPGGKTVPTAGIFVQCWVPTSCSGSRAELVVGKDFVPNSNSWKGVKTAMVKVWEKLP